MWETAENTKEDLKSGSSSSVAKTNGTRNNSSSSSRSGSGTSNRLAERVSRLNQLLFRRLDQWYWRADRLAGRLASFRDRTDQVCVSLFVSLEMNGWRVDFRAGRISDGHTDRQTDGRTDGQTDQSRFSLSLFLFQSAERVLAVSAGVR